MIGEKPFIAGRVACSQCERGQFYCNDGLCDGRLRLELHDLYCPRKVQDRQDNLGKPAPERF